MGLLNTQLSDTSVQVGGNTQSIKLTKGQKIDLTKNNPGLTNISVRLGWDANTTGQTYDLDAEVFMVNNNDKISSNDDLIFFNNKTSIDGAVIHMGDNLTGDGDGDDEIIKIQLPKVSTKIQKLIFAVTIYDAIAKRQNFGQISNAYIRIVNEENNNEICRFDLSEDYSTSISMIMGEVYRNNGEWKFSATGVGESLDLGGLCDKYSM